MGKFCQAVLPLLFVATGLIAQEWKGSEVVGVEIHGPKGRPIQGAKVLLTYSGPSGGVGPALVATDTKGKAVVTDLILGQWQIAVSHPDFLSYVAVLHLRPGKKAAVSASFLEATGSSLTPVKVKFFKAKNMQASQPLPDQRPVLAKQAPPSAPAPEPTKMASTEPPSSDPLTASAPEPPPVRTVDPNQPPTAVTPAVDTPVVRSGPDPVVPAPVPPKPIVEKLAVQEEAVEEPIYTETAVQEPVVEEPIIEESTAPAVVADKPSLPEPVAPEPLEPEIAIEEPVVEQSVAAPAVVREETPIPEPEPQPEPEDTAVQTPAPVEPTASEPAVEAEVELPAEEEQAPPPLPVTYPEAKIETPISSPEPERQELDAPAQQPDPEPVAEEINAPEPVVPEPVAAEPVTPEQVIPEPSEPEIPSITESETPPTPDSTIVEPIEPPSAPELEEPTPQLEEAPAPAETLIEPETAESPIEPVLDQPIEEPAVEVDVPQPVAAQPVQPPSAPSVDVMPAPPAGVVAIGSFRDDTCPDCQVGEWGTANSKAVGPRVGGSQCDQTLMDSARSAMQDLGNSINLELAGYLGPVVSTTGNDAAAIAESDLAASIRGALQPHLDGSSECQIVGLVLPKTVRYIRSRYFAADSNLSRECAAGSDCGLGAAKWYSSAQVEKGHSATIVWALFENSASDRQRRATLSVYFRTPNARWQPRTLGGQ